MRRLVLMLADAVPMFAAIAALNGSYTFASEQRLNYKGPVANAGAEMAGRPMPQVCAKTFLIGSVVRIFSAGQRPSAAVRLVAGEATDGVLLRQNADSYRLRKIELLLR